MGCSTSKLKGDAFEGIDSANAAYSTAYLPPLREKEGESKAFTPNTEDAPTGRARNSFRATVDPKEKKLGSSNAVSSPSTMPLPNASYVSRKEELQNSSSKLSTLRQQWKNRRGVPEPRDPVTGRGQDTGLTQEEVKQYVGSTRPERFYGMEADVFLA